MAEISKIALPNGVEYDIKDLSVLRNLIDGSSTGSVVPGPSSDVPSAIPGQYSTTVGTGVLATGRYAFAEGYGGDSSYSYASGIASHIEGLSTTANAYASHAEGYYTTASGSYSHAENYNTQASGYNSHANGCYTTAQRKSQTVIGEYNILDTTGTVSTRGDYSFIIGNGTSSTRSNALTVDWNGNLDIAGNLYSKSRVGMIEMFAGSTPPNKWLVCDGSAISRTDYATLYSVIGTTYGSGNGTTTFNLPDLRGRVPIGIGTGTATGATSHTLGQAEGEENYNYTPNGTVGNHTLTESQLPKITRTFDIRAWGSGNLIGNVSGWTSGSGSAMNNVTAGSTSVKAQRLSTTIGGGGAHNHSWTGTVATLNNMQPYLGINFIIYAGVYIEPVECCFVADTQILTSLSEDTKSIQNIDIGDTIVIQNVITGERLVTEALKVANIHYPTERLATVRFEDGTVLQYNPYHPIWTTEGYKTLGEYKNYPTLAIGNIAILKNGLENRITNIDFENILNGDLTTYNLLLKGVNDYYLEDEWGYFANNTLVHHGVVKYYDENEYRARHAKDCINKELYQDFDFDNSTDSEIINFISELYNINKNAYLEYMKYYISALQYTRFVKLYPLIKLNI